ncbi:glycosyltransferase family protein [Neosynechococcus sphagnicola]|uniref:glycosyltransferase family protein n=1 Tax=Neosynechococcus sphagnicola TaxID=1501145 RepID=UPI0023BAEC50|nr:glycosyltransferase family protein [Neosynechococcus sphagnicola]
MVCSFFRGSESDVLERYYRAAQAFNADIIVRVTSDCPLFDANILTEMLKSFINQTINKLQIDYLSNAIHPTCPRGLDAEIFTLSVLEKAYREAHQDHEREHVTPYIYQHPELFSLQNYSCRENFSHYRWTLDTPEDWEFIEAVYQVLYKNGCWFSTNEVLDLLERMPELVKINAHVLQKFF